MNVQYEKHSWTHLRDLLAQQPVLLLPVGSVEQHGPHLPIDTDTAIAWEFSKRVAERMDGKALVLPPIYYGYAPHHADFPGNAFVDDVALVTYVTAVVKSVAAHGFSRILLVNGHDSNIPMLDIVARRTTMETGALVGVLLMWAIVHQIARELPVIEMPVPDHGGEKETSMYLAIDEVNPDMTKAPGPAETQGREDWKDFYQASVLRCIDWFSTYTTNGVMGNAAGATADKGRLLFDHSVDQGVQWVERFHQRRRAARVDHHDQRPTESR